MVIRCSARFIYSTVYTKPSQLLKILTKKAPGSNLEHSYSHFPLKVLSVGLQPCIYAVIWGNPGLSVGIPQVAHAGLRVIYCTSLVLHAAKASTRAVEAATAHLGVIFSTRELRSEEEGVQTFFVSHAMTNVLDFTAHETTTSIM